MNQNIGKHIKIIIALQKKYPDLHVGGSIGLWLHGIELTRDLSKSDIDLCKAFDDIDLTGAVKKYEQGSAMDFDHKFIHNGIKIELRIDPEQEYDTVIYLQHPIKVTKLNIICAFKKAYSKDGHPKHANDILAIKKAGIKI